MPMKVRPGFLVATIQEGARRPSPRVEAALIDEVMHDFNTDKEKARRLIHILGYPERKSDV
jgi:hypothetical protein